MSDPLPPEIWSRIIHHLIRPIPLPDVPATWHDLHQHDLTVISRVSSTLHELAVPALYTSITFNRFSLLLNHLDDAPDSLREKVTSKKDRMKRTTRLRFALVTSPGILEKICLREVGEAANRDICATLGNRQYTDTDLLPNVNDMVFGQKAGGSLEIKLSWSADRHGYNPATGHLADFVRHLQPKQICIHDTDMLDYERWNAIIKTPNDTIITSHWYGTTESHTWFAGGTWRCALAGIVGKYSHLPPPKRMRAIVVDRLNRDILHHERNHYFTAAVDRTKLEYYGECYKSPSPMYNREKEATEDRALEASGGTRHDEATEEDDCEDRLHQLWKRKVKFGSAADFGVCEGCGVSL